MKAALQQYHVRMQRVLDHIDSHLDCGLDLDTLSSVAAFSKYHFHRQFTATFGLSVYRYVQLARMKRASYRLAYRIDETVTDIAMDAGYDAPDAFARAFRKRFGQSPSAFRTSPDWQPWTMGLRPLDDARRKLQKTYTPADVAIREIAPTPVAMMAHRGDPATIGATIQRFVAWRIAADLTLSATFTIFYSDPRTTPPTAFRLDLCAGTDRLIEAHDVAVKAGVIPGGRCAVLRIVGTTDNLDPAALYLYRDWLPVSGEEPRDFPIYCQHIDVFPNVPEHEAVTELFLPLELRS